MAIRAILQATRARYQHTHQEPQHQQGYNRTGDNEPFG